MINRKLASGLTRSLIRSPIRSAISSVFERRASGGAAADPTLSTPTAATINETSANASVVSNRDNGLMYWVASTSATQPTPTQIKAGQNHLGATVVSGIQAISATGVQTVFGGVIGLTDATAYWIHFYMETDALEPSNTATSNTFTTGDVTAPVLSSAEGTQTGATTANLSVNTDTGAGTLYWVATTAATTPSAAQIIASQNHLGAASVGASRAVLASGPQAFGITGLTGSTTYWAHFVHRDVALNTSNVITSSASFTTTSITFYFQAYHNGSTSPVAAAANGTTSANYADSLGGNNAILWSGDGLGPGSAEVVSLTTAITYANAQSRIKCRFRVVNQSAAKMWLRIAPVSVTSAEIIHIDITNDGTPDGSRVGASGWVAGATLTGLGSGWFEFSGVYDPTGDADRVGFLVLYMASVNNSSGIVNNVAGANQIAVHDMNAEQI